MLGAILFAISAPPFEAASPAFLRFETGRHTASVRGIARDPASGDWITVGFDKAVRRWHEGRPAGPPLRFATGGTNFGFASCDVSAKGMLAVGDYDSTGPSVWLYPLTGGAVQRIRLPRTDENDATTFLSVAFSPDGSLLATGDNAGALRVWNVASRNLAGGRLVVPGTGATGYGVFGIAFSGGRLAYAAAANGSRATDQKGYLGIVDPGKKELPELSHLELDHRIVSLDWHDPKALAVGGAKGSLDLWAPGDTKTTSLATGLSALLTGVRRSADGKATVAGAADGSLVAFSGSDAPKTLRPAEGAMWTVALAPNGAVLAGMDSGEVVETDLTGAKPHDLSPPAPAATELRWSAGGDALRWRSDKAPTSFNLLRTEPGAAQQDAAEDGHRLGGASLAADPKTGLVALSGVADWTRLTQDAPAYDAVFLDADHVLAATTRGLQVHDRLGIPTTLPSEGGIPRSLARSPDGSKVAVGFNDGVVRIYAAKPFGTTPIASLFVGSGEWVAWSESTGRYDSSVGGDSIFGYQINRGETALATFVPAIMKKDDFRKPGLLSELFGAGAPPPPPANPEASPLAQSLAEVPAINVVGVEDGRQTAEGWEIDGKEATVKVHVQNQTTGRLSARVGHGTPRDLPGVIDVENLDGSDRYCKVSGLAPGPNLVQLFLGSQPLKGSDFVVVSKQADAAAAPERILVLAIGVGEYGKPEMKDFALGYAVSDAKGFVQTIKDLSPGTGDAEIKPLFDAAASRTEIEKGFDWLQTEAKPTDRVMVYIASHGDPRKEATYITPYDYTPTAPAATGIAWTEIAKKLSDVNCRSLVLFSDNCYSGAAVQAARQTQTTQMRGLISDMAVFAACGADQRSYEFDDLKHGLFTYALLAGLRGEIAGQAADRATGLVTTDILKASLPTFMRDLQAEKKVGDPQTPIILVPDHSVPITRLKKVSK